VDVSRQLHNFNIDNAMNKFEYYEKKIDLMEGQVDSLNMERRGLQSEFEELARKEKIDQELQEIRKKLNKLT
jgi:phage shock protein A